MDTILIIDPDPEHAAALERELKMLSCGITVCHHVRSALDILKRQLVDILVLVADVKGNWGASIEALRDAIHQLTEPPGFVCVLRGPYQGPGERLYGARRGVRVIHEKQ